MKLKTTLIALLCIMFGKSFSQTEPNIILIIADDMGWSQTSTGLTNLNNPSDFYETPILETLASEGIAFPHGYVNGGNCAPTRAAILSGQYAARPTNNVFNVYDLNRGNTSGNSTLIGPTMGLPGSEIDEIPASAITIAETMKTAGYATAHFGKFHMGEDENTNVSNNAATDQGFDKNYGGGTKGTPGAYHATNSSGSWKWNANIQGTDLDSYANPYTTTESEMLLGSGNTTLNGVTKHVTDAMTFAALDFMNANNSSPFFLHFSNFAVHSPTANQHARPDLLAKYQAKTPSSSMGHTNLGLAAILEGMDQSIGVLVNYLKTTADPRNPGHMLSENTLIYFISDNGGAVNTQENGPLRGMKGEYYEGGIRSVTVAWSDPAGNLLANPGTVNTTPVVAFDLYPTFAEAAGASLPVGYDIDGVSQWQMLTNGTSMTRESLFWHFPGYLIDSKRAQRPVTVVRKGDYKLHHFYESAEYELYNLSIDIEEANNLLPSADQAVIDIANDMIDDMISHLNDTSAPLPTYRSGGATVPMPTWVSLDVLTNSTDGCQPTSGYEAFWDFDASSNTDDASSNGHNATTVSGTLSYDNSDFKEGDQSVIFNGSTEIEYSNGAFLTNATTARSISVWIKPTTLIGTQEIFEEGGSGNGLALRLNGSNIEASLSNNQGGNLDPNHTISSAFPNDANWHHVALVFNGTSSEMLLYIDGILENTTTGSYTELANHTSPGGIGGVISGDAFGSLANDSFFNGKMDGLAVYGSVLSEVEIQNSACYTPPSNGCVTMAKNDFEAFWDFDIANSADDASGNNHDPQIAISSGISFDSSDFKDGNQSIVFNGTEAIQYATNSGSPDNFLNTATSSRSIAVWIKPNNLSGLQNIFDEGGNNKGIAIRLSGNNLESVIRDTGSTASNISAIFPNDGAWHHVAMVYDGGSSIHKLYIDGSEVADNGTGVPSVVASNLSYGGIGGRLSGKDSFQNDSDTAIFSGKMDAFAVSNDALSGDQINSLVKPWYLGVDNDNDGFFSNQIIINQCSSPGAGYSETVLVIDDCDDNEPLAYPGNTEILYDGIDNDCNPLTLDTEDADNDGVNSDTDCDDNEPLAYPGNTEILYDGIDNDCNPLTLDTEDADNDGVNSDTDCDDNEPLAYPGNTEILYDGIDNDCNPLTLDTEDADNDGVNSDTDCDDNEPLAYPGNTEILYDGIDNDCNPLTLDTQDADNDGVNSDTDCDDNEPLAYPGNTEILYDGIDNDCNPLTLDTEDADNDGVNSDTDCDDNEPLAYPGNTEILYDGIDNDCNPLTLDTEDADNDGVNSDTDCDDNEPLAYPGNTEILYDGIDNDCNPLTLDTEDADNDGVNSDTDCDDNEPLAYPGNTEILYDGIDNDCNPLTLDTEDADNDGVNSDTDCDDNEPLAYPGNTEILYDGIDNDCNPLTLDTEDADNDGVNSDTDCDDNEPLAYPGNTEILYDGIDNDCNPLTLDTEDADNDGVNSDTDCDDNEPLAYPGNTEILYDGIDNDCNPLTLDTEDADNDGVNSDTDCDDNEPLAYPGNTEILYDGIDNDCNPLTLDTEDTEDTEDADNDGVNSDTDCDDNEPLAYPGNTEILYDGIDNDCNPLTLDTEDADNDGVNSDTDCDDNEPLAYPGNTEILYDGIDNDCNPLTLDTEDADNDGVNSDTDCDDNEPLAYPGNTEILYDGIDNDCNPLTLDTEDADNDGVNSDTDCDDNEPLAYPGNTEILYDGIDNDCNPLTLDTEDADNDGVNSDTDCDDNEPLAYPGNTEILYDGIDNDCNPLTLDTEDADNDGVNSDTDCDDNEPLAYPGNTEILYDGIDNDCNPLTLDTEDADNDGVNSDTDCDDNEPLAYPGNTEILYDGIDNDCNPLTLDTEDTEDADNDGVNSDTDCDDNEPLAYPGNTEILYDGIDNDCNPLTLDTEDADNDGVNSDTDCDDNEPLAYPGNTEILYDGIDNDCNPLTLDTEDADNDGVNSDTDCDDNEPLAYPGNTEILYDGIDNDCNPLTLDTEDADNDGVNSDTDCDDNEPLAYPGNTEILYDGIDNDCNPLTLDTEDADNDGVNSDTDCDDNEPLAYPGNTEILYDGIDNDCNPLTLDTEDADNDGVNSDTDCDDNEPLAYPGNTEILYDGIDNDCNPLTLDDDLDEDGFNLVDDCDDTDANINPDATEVPGNSVDEDCDGTAQATLEIDVFDLGNVQILPNPFNEYVSIKLPKALSGREFYITIYDLHGRLVMRRKSKSRAGMIHMSNGLSRLSEGAYFIKLEDHETKNTIMKKLVKH